MTCGLSSQLGTGNMFTELTTVQRNMAASLQAKLTCCKIDCFILRVSELSRLLGEIALRSRSVIWAICTWIPGVVAVIWTDHALLTLESGVSSYRYKASPATIANQRHSI